MAHTLGQPGPDGDPDWDSLYRARVDEVSLYRPIFTGDIFEKITVQGIPNARTKTIMIFEHPCALRTDGVNLRARLFCAEVRTHPVIKDWKQHASKMPLPNLISSATSGKRNQAAFLGEPYLVEPEALNLSKRIACLSELGVNLLHQRLVFAQTRATIPTVTFHEAMVGQYDEAEITEFWCEDRAEFGDVPIDEAAAEAVKWLRETVGARTRQDMLKDPQARSVVRQQMRERLKGLRQQRPTQRPL